MTKCLAQSVYITYLYINRRRQRFLCFINLLCKLLQLWQPVPSAEGIRSASRLKTHQFEFLTKLFTNPTANLDLYLIDKCRCHLHMNIINCACVNTRARAHVTRTQTLHDLRIWRHKSMFLHSILKLCIYSVIHTTFIQ